jgi:predicted O-methyltransferase YrrM
MTIKNQIISAVKTGLRPFGLTLSRVGMPIRRLTSAEHFHERFLSNLRKCDWSPHLLYSSFTQCDQEFYLAKPAEFLHKYRCFWAVSRTISPRAIIELGCLAGSSADAYLSATPSASYTGFDVFREETHRTTGLPWLPFEIAHLLAADRGFTQYEFIKRDLRTLHALPGEADFVVVDAAHDFENQYADLLLALSARPTFIYVDDMWGKEVQQAVERFLSNDVRRRLEYTVPLDYFGGGLVIKLRL